MAFFRPRLNVWDFIKRSMQMKGWSGRGDLNSRPLGPEPSALPSCATPRTIKKRYAQSAKRLAQMKER